MVPHIDPHTFRRTRAVQCSLIEPRHDRCPTSAGLNQPVSHRSVSFNGLRQTTAMTSSGQKDRRFPVFAKPDDSGVKVTSTSESLERSPLAGEDLRRPRCDCCESNCSHMIPDSMIGSPTPWVICGVRTAALFSSAIRTLSPGNSSCLMAVTTVEYFVVAFLRACYTHPRRIQVAGIVASLLICYIFSLHTK